MSKLLAFLLFTFLFLSCRKNTEEVVVLKNIDVYTGDIVTADHYGYVEDENGNPIEGARVSLRNQVEITDSVGIYQFDNIKVHSNIEVLTIQSPNYKTSFRTIHSRENKQYSHSSIMQTKSEPFVYRNGAEGVITSEELNIEIRNQSFVYSDGSVCYDDISIYSTYYSPNKKSDFLRNIPGGFYCIDTENRNRGLTIFGAVEITAESASKVTLQIAPKGSIKIKIKAFQPENDYPALLALWRYDNDLGVWLHNGYATHVENSFYQLDISEVGIYAIGESYDYVSVDFTLLSSDQYNMPFFEVVALNERNEIVSFTKTNRNSGAIIRVPANERITLRILNKCDKTFGASHVLEPLIENTNLGNIIMSHTSAQYFIFDTDIYGCGGDLLKGYVEIDGVVYSTEVKNNNFIFPRCNNDYKLKIVDEFNSITLYESYKAIDLLSGEVSICNTQLENLLFVIIDNNHGTIFKPDEFLRFDSAINLYRISGKDPDSDCEFTFAFEKLTEGIQSLTTGVNYEYFSFKNYDIKSTSQKVIELFEINTSERYVRGKISLELTTTDEKFHEVIIEFRIKTMN